MSRCGTTGESRAADLAAVRELRAMGAVRVRVGDVEATFAGASDAPIVNAPVPLGAFENGTLTEEQRKAEADRLAFYSGGG